MKAIKFLSILLISVLVWTQLSSQTAGIEVDGAITIANSNVSDNQPGTIRFNDETNDFEGWNGLYWASLTGYQYEIGSVTDVDGNVYTTVKIGGQEWMAENLRTSSWNSNGQPIGEITDNMTWSTANYSAWCWYDNDPSYDEVYGKLYNWYVVNDSRGVCPMDWAVPNENDWQELIDELGVSVNGPKLRERGMAYWDDEDFENDGNNESGFSARGGGLRNANSGDWSKLLKRAYFWSITEDFGNGELTNLLPTGNLLFLDLSKNFGFSIRCVKY